MQLRRPKYGLFIVCCALKGGGGGAWLGSISFSGMVSYHPVVSDFDDNPFSNDTKNDFSSF